MKKIIAILCAVILFSGINLHAAPVSSSRAMEIAKKIFAAQPATKAGSAALKIVWDGEDVATKAAQPAFYVIARDGGGFVIIAGDDNVQPVLAISDHNEFKVEGMPENVRWWMDRMKAYVRDVKTQTPEVKAQWSRMISTKALSGTFTNEFKDNWTCEWDQSNPANILAPTVEGQGSQSVAGCLPLALAEILTWHGAPNMATGSSTAYSYTSENGKNVNIPAIDPLSGYVSLTNADWAALKALKTNDDFKGCSDELKAKISQLVYACGVLLKAKFNAGIYGGTSSSSSEVVKAFGEHMGYNKGAYRDFLSNHSDREWESMLKAEISLRPVLYCGQSYIGGNDAGHAYVFDGFATLNGTDNVFHVNFGWGGSCNGYYYAAYQDTRPEQNYVYNMDLEALFDFYPKAGGSYITRLKAIYSNAEYPGVRAGLEQYGYVLTYMIFNYGESSYNGQVKLSIQKKNGTIIDNIWSNDVIDLAPNSGTGSLFGYVDLGEVGFGDKVVCYYKDGDDWVLLDCPAGMAVAEWPLMPATFIKTADSYNQNDWFQFELMNIDDRYLGTVWTLTAPDGTSVVKHQPEYEVQLTKKGVWKIEAAVAPTPGTATVETLVTSINVE